MDNSTVRRFGVSMEAGLLKNFDSFVLQKGLINRSEAVRQLVRHALMNDLDNQRKGEVVGTILLIYDLYDIDRREQMTAIQNNAQQLILAVTQVHLKQQKCLEMIAVTGDSLDVQSFYEKLHANRGIYFSDLNITPLELS